MLCVLAVVGGAVVGLGVVGVPPVGLLAFENPPVSEDGAGLRADAAPPGPTRVPAPLVVGPTRLARLTGAGMTSDTPIPATALAAYQRAAAVLAEARPRCGLEWSLLAAIGKVESDHGTVGATDLRKDGMSVPALVGPPFDGRHHRATVRDSDGGRLDGDRTWDRAVGPLQVLPSTWTVVGVDGDGDGVRAPDDIDDAALAVGVALCAGRTGLDTRAGMREALLRYNASGAYADRVLAVERLYRDAGLPEASATPTFAATPVMLRDTRARITRLVRHPETLVPVPTPAASATVVPDGRSAHATLGSDATAGAAPEPSSPVADLPGTDPAGTPTAEEPATSDPATACPEPTGATSETPQAGSSNGPVTPDPSADPSLSAEPPASPTDDPTDDPCADPALSAPEEPAPTAAVSPSTPAGP